MSTVPEHVYGEERIEIIVQALREWQCMYKKRTRSDRRTRRRPYLLFANQEAMCAWLLCYA